jgi:glycosyltransferase involved in cell wall biosynthesis
MRGWGSADLISQLPRMSAGKAGKIRWLEGVSDNLLSKLYEDALFTLFPSIYEGWGLAATEAMLHGKVCIVSNNSALREATNDIMPCFHPYDFGGWSNEISRLIDDSAYRTVLESKVKESFIRRTWDDFGDEFIRQVLHDV